MGTYNVSKIEGWLKDFTSAKDKFTNTYYSDYKNSYIRSCNDSAVITMRNKLNQHYDRINRINKRIKDVWDDFLYDLKAIDNRLAGGKGSTNDSAVASKLSKLPTLKEYKATLKTRINSASAVVGTVDKIGWAEDKDLGSNLQSVLDRTEATITVAGTAVIEGIGNFGEGLMDLCSPIVTEGYCQFNLMFNEDFTEETAEEARQNSRDFVAKEHVKTFFEDAYSPELREKAFGFDTVRAVGNEVGEVVGAIGIAALTQGAVNPAVLYGAAKAGNHIEENFQDENNGYLESILKGGAEGIFDGLFFYAGMKGDAVMKSAAKEVVKEGGKATLKKGGILFAKSIYECGCSVVQDGTNILIDSIFLNGPVSASDGSVIQNPSFLDKLNYCFEQSGGMKGIVTSMMTATVLSSVSDAVDLRGIKNVDTNTALKNADVNINSKTINKNLKKMQSLPKTLAGLVASGPATLSKMKNVDITPNSKIFKKIQDQGLYHFTDEVSAKKILDSGYIKESSHFTSYGKKRTFMFAGVPSVEATCLNDVFDYKKTAVKLHPSDTEIGNLQYRKYSDSAVSSLGNYDITNSSPEIAYLVLKEQDGALKYVEVTKVEYDNYNPHFNDNVINKTVENVKKKLYQTRVGISAEYDNVIKGVKQYSNDFKDKLYKMTKKSTNTNIDTKKLNVNKTNNSNGFKIVEDITGGAAADEQVLKQVDEILNFDVNSNNIKNSVDNNLESLRKEYDELMKWKSSDKFVKDEAYYQAFRDNIGGNPYKKNMDRIAELERILNENDQILKSKDINGTTLKNSEDKILLKRKDTTLAQNLNSYHFNKLSLLEQEKYIKSCNVNQLKNLIQDEEIIRKYSKIIDEKIIKNQDLIFIKGLSPLETGAFNKYIFDNEYILKNISNDNLVLLIGSSFDGDPIDNALKEAEKRIKNGDVLFEGNVIRKGLFNADNNYAFNAVNKMPEEIQNIIIKNGREISAKLPVEIRDIDYGNTGLLQKMSLGKMYANGELDATSINFIKNINDNGIGGLSKANTKLFNKEIINNLGEDYIIEVMNYPELSKKVVSLFNNDRKLFDSFSEVMKKNLTDDSLNTFYIKNESYLNFVFDNQEALKNVDSSVLKSDTFMNFVLYNSNSYNVSNSISKKIPVDFSADYERKLAQYCDNLFNKSIEANNTKSAKDAYFQKYFSISYDEARTFVSKYSDHINEVIKYDNNQTANTIVNLFKKIDETEDLSYLKKLYDTQEFNFNAEEMISLDSTIKEVYSKSYVDKLTQTNDYIKSKLNQNHEIIDFNGKKVDMIDIDNNFNFIVHSSDTGYVVDKELVNNSYIDTWKSISPETHGLSASYISDTNIGSAPVGGKGVLYAFNDINTKNIGIMAPYDVNGNVANYGFSSGNKQIYISADEMSNNTLRVYNELVLDRKSVKPSYVIVYTDMSKESVDSAIKAASEWDVPVIRIDKTNLAKKQLSQINGLIDRFNKSGDLNLLDKALNKYEANVAGYKLNSNVADGAVDATSSINNDIVADLFNSSHIENTIMDYASKTDNVKNINDVIAIMQGIKDKYDIVNLNGTKIVANTKSSFDIDTIIEMLREKIGV